ncbi:FecCD family ABC transporter permease [Glutamicibacter sp. NPDC087661]|uniref:FecCD family ABC transporter permease n=1 Tax=unclassified Glutamicibacter TaxID=2627139 RepID=UPI0037F9705B
MSAVDFGPGHRVLRIGRIWLRVQPRQLLLAALLSVLAAALGLYALATGDYTLGLGEVLNTLAGAGEASSQRVVLQWRLPRVLMALLLGAALGASGAIFQSMTRNPLGSPDIIGFNTGAYTGALAVMLVFGGGYFQVALGALAGGLATAAVVYALSFKNGSEGFRLIIVGIAVSAILASANTWLILRSELEDAMSAAIWGAGSLNAIGWDQATPAAAVALPLALGAMACTRRMRLLELGDDAAVALGINTESSKLSLLVIGVALTALATAAAGPIAFISLAAPQIARRIMGSAGVSLAYSALLGAVLLLASDVLAQRVLENTSLPVGVVTVSIGGVYLIWLLLREARRQ